MELLLVLLLVMAGLMVMAWVGLRRTRHRDAPMPQEFDPNDLAALSASMAAIAAEFQVRDSAIVESRLRMRLQRVINRRCPVRAITAAPIPGATRICFADGTGILVRCQQGRLALLAYTAGRHPVCLRSCRLGPDGPELTFDYYGGQLTAVMVGFDQAD